MRRKIILISALILLSLPLAGCEVLQDTITGEKKVYIDPNAAAKVEDAAEVGVGILEALAALWPAAGIGAAGLGTALAAWRKAKKNLTTTQTKSDMYYNATQALVNAIEDYREENPGNWAKLKKQLERSVGPGVESIIRAIRELPPKV